MNAWHERAIKGVLDTPPIVPQSDGVVLFSMIGTAVLLPYLVAVKSLWSHLRMGRVVLLDDGTLTDADRAVLAYHCGQPLIIPIASVDRTGFPKGGCWERFLTILDHRAEEYWIQLDSDTVTLGPVEEVRDAILSNRSFTLLGGADAGEMTLPLPQFVRQFYPDGPVGGHVQKRIESRMAKFRNPEWRYIRGCAGFAGFSKGGAGRDLAAAFLAELQSQLGDDDAAIWGTEQVASNFQIAQEADAVMLPYARYMNYWGEDFAPDTRFVHYVGTHRFTKGSYAEHSRRAIAAMGW